MNLGINGSTIELCDMNEFLDVAAETGYSAVELRQPKIEEYLQHHSFNELRATLARRNLRVASINSIENATMRTPEAEKEVLAKVDLFAGWAAEVGCPWLIICPGVCPDGTGWDEIVAKTAPGLARIADVAWRKRVGVAFEFLGFPGISVRTPADAWAICKEANRHNLGLAVDVANFHSGRGRLSEISVLPADAVAIFHINDLRRMRPEDAGAYDRVMPGDGMSPAAEIVRELKRIGFSGVCSVETFNHDYNQRPPREVAAEAAKKTLALIA